MNIQHASQNHMLMLGCISYFNLICPPAWADIESVRSINAHTNSWTCSSPSVGSTQSTHYRLATNPSPACAKETIDFEIAKDTHFHVQELRQGRLWWMLCISVSGKPAHGSHRHGYLLQLWMSWRKDWYIDCGECVIFRRLSNSRRLAWLLILRWLVLFKILPCESNM